MVVEAVELESKRSHGRDQIHSDDAPLPKHVNVTPWPIQCRVPFVMPGEPLASAFAPSIGHIRQIPLQIVVDKTNSCLPATPIRIIDDEVIHFARISCQKVIPIWGNLMEQHIEDDGGIAPRKSRQ